MDIVQVRVLGALMEKEITTPDVYPLSLNALLSACNQRSNREPVMDLQEEQVRQALHALEDRGWTSVVRDSRVAKYEHRIRTVWNLRRDETALLCLLFLRGPQTPGELRARAERLYSFDDLEAVESTLQRLASRAGSGQEGSAAADGTGPLAAVLPRQPGSREARWVHLLGGPAGGKASGHGAGAHGSAEVAGSGLAGADVPDESRLREVEQKVAALTERLAAMEDRLARLEGNSTAAPAQ